MAERAATAPSRRPPTNRLRDAILVAGLVGSAVLAISQFLTLSDAHVSVFRHSIGSITVGSEHAYALLPVAVVAAVLAYAVWAVGSRPALLAIGVLGLVSLLIALLHDLSYAHSTGLKSIAGHYVLAGNRPAAGFYAELAGSLILLVYSVSGFALTDAPQARRRRTEIPRPAAAPDLSATDK